MRTAAKTIAHTGRHEDAGHEDAIHQFAGMLIVSLFPALFWTLTVAGVGAAVGHAPSAMALMAFGTGVAVFCAAAFQALTAHR